jgi:hypothetical protein
MIFILLAEPDEALVIINKDMDNANMYFCRSIAIYFLGLLHQILDGILSNNVFSGSHLSVLVL